MRVPFVDLKTQFEQIKTEVFKDFEDICNTSGFILGKYVSEFETKFAKLLNSKNCVCCSNGTTALHLALLALDIGAGDEVITVPNTFVATVEAIVHAGARPVLVDINPDTHNIDVSKIEAAITDKTKAILPVHLYGQPADMELILDIAKKHNLYVIEDGCQAHLAEYKGKFAGTMGDIGCFSFYPGKNLGTYGDGGGVVTDSDELAEKINLLRAHGSPRKYEHSIIGYNYRMSALQGAVLNIKADHIEKWTNMRRENAALYSKLIQEKNIPVKVPFELEGTKPVYHLYVVNTERRDELMKFLNSKDIDVILHYPIPIHLQEAFKYLGYKEGDFPVTEKDVTEIMSLPMYPELTAAQIEYVTDCMQEFFNKA